MSRLPKLFLTPEAAADGNPMALHVYPGSTVKELAARIGRSKTLDGSVHYDHRGLTDADQIGRAHV